MTDDELIAGFEDCSLEPFHHCDHVRMAFLYLSRYPALEAVQRFSSSLGRFATAKGKPGLYHETVTWAFLLFVSAWREPEEDRPGKSSPPAIGT